MRKLGWTLKMKTALILALAAGLFATATAIAAPTTFGIGDVTFEFDPGSNYCALDSDVHEMDKVVITQQRRLHRGNNEFVAMFIRCSELNAFRSAIPVTQFRILLASYLKGHIQPYRGMDRSTYLNMLARQLNERIKLDPEAITNHVMESIDPDMRTAVEETTLAGTHSLGMISRDEFAIYHGVMTRHVAAGITDTSIMIMGETLVKGFPLKFGLFRNDINPTTVDEILHELRPLMTALVNGNDTSGTAISEKSVRSLNWNDARDHGLSGFVIFGVVVLMLVIIVILVRRRGRVSKKIRLPVSSWLWFTFSCAVLVILFGLQRWLGKSEQGG